MIVSLIFALAIAPISVQWFIGLANGSALVPTTEVPPGLATLLARLTESPWSTPTLLFIAGFTAGVWVDWCFSLFDDRRRRARQGLGARLTQLGDELARLEFGSAKSTEWPANLGDARRGVARALARMRQFGIWNPGAAAFRIPRGGEFLIDFFREIGALLQSERFDEAKARARAAQLRFELIGRHP